MNGIHVRACAIESDNTPPEIGLGVEIWPIPRELLADLAAAIRDTTTAFLVERGLSSGKCINATGAGGGLKQ